MDIDNRKRFRGTYRYISLFLVNKRGDNGLVFGLIFGLSYDHTTAALPHHSY